MKGVTTMNFIRKIASSDILENIIDIPDSLKHREVEIIILPLDKIDNQTAKAKRKSVRGILEKYKNTELISREHSAWAGAVEDKYANS